MILLMVDLRVVDILGVDVVLDMDELIAIGLLVSGTLTGLSYTTRSWSWERLHIYVVGCVCAWNFGTKFFLRRGECETPRKLNFLEKWQNRNFDKNPKFFLISDDEKDFTVGIVSQNLANTSIFFKFRDSQNLHIFQGNERCV